MTSSPALHLRPAATASTPRYELESFVRHARGLQTLDLLVDGAHCARCISKIETAASGHSGVVGARFNLSLRKLTVSWRGEPALAGALSADIEMLGYRVAPFTTDAAADTDRKSERELLRALAIAGFASANVMMLSWAVWAGDAQGMAPATRILFNGLSAAVATPAILVAGRSLFVSAFRALRARGSNMDVPISAGLLLTLAISFVQLARGGDVYFDSASALLFTLLVGRYLERRARGRAREAIERLLMLQPQTAEVVQADGAARRELAQTLTAGVDVLVRPGEPVPADGRIIRGRSDLDLSIVSGESMPVAVGPGDDILAGGVNGAGLLVVRTTRAPSDSHLASIVRLVAEAEARRGPAATIADRAARLWTPCVHGLGLLTFVGWLVAHPGDIATAMLHAVSVLIIACPCAIGLAVPAVQTVAIGALLKRGVLLRSGEALERLAAINHVVFDKTGTLSLGAPIMAPATCDPSTLRTAAWLATASSHPLARAICAMVEPMAAPSGAREHPGEGVSLRTSVGEFRLGSATFCDVNVVLPDGPRVWLTQPGCTPVGFHFRDPPRPEALATVRSFTDRGVAATLLSGDRPEVIAPFAVQVGIEDARGGLRPEQKAAIIYELGLGGARVLMVGDGLNDAPALSEAFVSVSFAHGAGATQGAADIILPAGRLDTIVVVHRLARRAVQIMRQNLGLAAVYNAICIPLAVMGLVSPLMAAIAMSASSLTVTLNALRAGGLAPADRTRRAAP